VKSVGLNSEYESDGNTIWDFNEVFPNFLWAPIENCINVPIATSREDKEGD
jgi:hypothetical protein